MSATTTGVVPPLAGPLAAAAEQFADACGITPAELVDELAARFTIVCEAITHSYVGADVLAGDLEVLDRFIETARHQLIHQTPHAATTAPGEAL
jgi:hypothetical protein